MKNDLLLVEDRITFQYVVGGLFSTDIGPEIDHMSYIPNNLRVGWILNDPGDEDNPFRGCFELIGELSISGIISDYGNILIGPTAIVRYNFVQPNWFAVPYIQVGGGFVYNDAYEDKTQRAVGQAIEFTPQAGAGVRWLIDEQWSFDTEFMYHHISNACMNDRNLGVNSLGGLVGFTYFFENLWED